MLKHSNYGESREWPNQSHIDHRPLPPHIPYSAPHHNHSPHIRSSRICFNYNDTTIARLGQLYENVEYAISVLETCPPEIKLTLAMLLDIQVDLSQYPQESNPIIRFETPLLDEKNCSLIKRTLMSNKPETVESIYKQCPPEQVILALAVASLKKNRDDT